MNKFTLLLTLATSPITFCQLGGLDWVTVAGGNGGEHIFEMAVDSDGNSITTGYFAGPADFDPNGTGYVLPGVGNWDAFVQKHDSLGNLLWAFQIGTPENDQGLSVATDSQGNIYTCGVFRGFSIDLDPGPGSTLVAGDGTFFDGYIAKYDPNGNIIWGYSIGGTSLDYCFDIHVDNVDNVYVTGSFRSTVDFDPGPGITPVSSGGEDDTFLLKLTSDGYFNWVRRISSDQICAGYEITTGNDGGLAMTGLFRGTIDLDPGPAILPVTAIGQRDAYIVKMDSSGTFQWGGVQSGFGWDVGLEIAIDSNNNVLVSGSFADTIDVDPGPSVSNLIASYSGSNEDTYLSKLDANGNFLWGFSIGGIFWDHIHELEVDAVGNSYIAGAFRDTIDFDPGPGTAIVENQGGYDAFIMKVDPSGAMAWIDILSSPYNEIIDGMSVTNNSIYLAGRYSDSLDFDTGPGNYTMNGNSISTSDIFVARYDNPTAKLVNLQDNTELVLFPNPTDGVLQIIRNSDESIRLDLTNSLGQLLEEIQSSEVMIEVDLTDYEPGVYYLRDENNKPRVYKVIRQ